MLDIAASVHITTPDLNLLKSEKEVIKTVRGGISIDKMKQNEIEVIAICFNEHDPASNQADNPTLEEYLDKTKKNYFFVSRYIIISPSNDIDKRLGEVKTFINGCIRLLFDDPNLTGPQIQYRILEALNKLYLADCDEVG